MSNETEWVLVPREPTAEMVQASDEISCRAEGAEHWAAMLEAAPQPPAEAQPVEKGRGVSGRDMYDVDDFLARANPPPSAPVEAEAERTFYAQDFYEEAREGKKPWPAQQPAAIGEEIMVNAAHDVYTLPLHPSGLSSGPRFVVHVPAPEQPAAPTLAKYQPCGCVICTCEDEQQCQGCGAKHCGNFADHPPYVVQQPAAVDGAATNSAVAAIQFALKDPEGMTFLRLWNEGDFDTLRREWPDAPVEVYIDADPLAAQQGGSNNDR